MTQTPTNITPAAQNLNHDWFTSFAARVKFDQDNIIQQLGPNDLVSPSKAITLAANSLTIACFQDPDARIYLDAFTSIYDVKILDDTPEKDLALLFRQWCLDYYAASGLNNDENVLVQTTINTLDRIEQIYFKAGGLK